MSGYSDDVVLQHRLTTHGVVLVQKPFTAETLVQKVHQALAAQSEADATVNDESSTRRVVSVSSL
jgi:hypothetical protein